MEKGYAHPSSPLKIKDFRVKMSGYVCFLLTYDYLK